MKKWAVIADDLTGANDTGVQFANNQLKTHVLFSDSDIEDREYTKCDVLVINSDSRSLSKEGAYEQLHLICNQLKKVGVTHLINKVDSTLRGNIGAEIDAIMDAFSFKNTLFVPAFPSSHRVTINGLHYVNGLPLEESEMAKDPVHPINDSYVPTIIRKQSKRNVSVVPLEDVKRGKSFLAQRLKAITENGESNIIVIDATNDHELITIVESADLLMENFLWSGSAGISRHIAEKVKKEAQESDDYKKDRDPILVVAGSMSNTTHLQITKLLRDQRDIQHIAVSPYLLMDPYFREMECGRIMEVGSEHLKKGDLVICLDRDSDALSRLENLKEEKKLDKSYVSTRIAETLAEIAANFVEKFNLQLLILTGGDIALATCKVLQGKGIRVLGEVETGIPYGKLLGGPFEGLAIITKAGALGTEGAFVKSFNTIDLL